MINIISFEGKMLDGRLYRVVDGELFVKLSHAEGAMDGMADDAFVVAATLADALGRKGCSGQEISQAILQLRK